MKSKICISVFISGLLVSAALCAQSVLYTSAVTNASTMGFEVIGKAGNFYWIQKSKKPNSFRKRTAPRTDIESVFEIYDARLNPVTAIPYTIPNAVQKQYLIAGTRYFDQLLFTSIADTTRVIVNRFTTDGRLVADNVTLLNFPRSMQAADFLLVRSQDKTKLLLLGFEPVEESAPRLHAVLYDSDWNVLSKNIYTDPNLTQPFLQYDFTNTPLEHFDNSTVKLADNGDWLMVTPARHNNNHVLFHFQGSSFVQTAISLTPRSGVRNASLVLDNVKREAVAGIQLNTSVPALKKVRIAQYNLSQCQLQWDTAYRFRPLAVHKKSEEHLYEQYFIPVAGGFLFLKEYGRPYRSPYGSEALQLSSDDEATTEATIDPAPAAFNKDDYTRYSHLSGTRQDYDRGDLNVYYFPATRQDSCWSGLINKPQTGELNSSFLSYACLPLEDRIVFLYNSLSYIDVKLSSTTILDQKGHSLNEGLIFWKRNNIFDIQKAKQIAARELAVPYEKNGLRGFAIIRL